MEWMKGFIDLLTQVSVLIRLIRGILELRKANDRVPFVRKALAHQGRSLLKRVLPRRRQSKSRFHPLRDRDVA